MSRHLDAAAIAAFDDLAGESRRRAVEHLGRCAACRAAVLQGDASRMFAALGTVDPPAAALARLDALLDRSLPPRRAAPAAGRIGRRLALHAGPIAASVVLGLALGAFLVTRPDPAGARPQTVADAATSAPAGAADETAWAASDAVGGIRLIDSPEHAQVVELSVGATQVVMIFDTSVDL